MDPFDLRIAKDLTIQQMLSNSFRAFHRVWDEVRESYRSPYWLSCPRFCVEESMVSTVVWHTGTDIGRIPIRNSLLENPKFSSAVRH